MSVNLLNKRERSLKTDYVKMGTFGPPKFLKEPRKSNDISGKGPRKMQWSESCKVSTLKATCGHMFVVKGCERAGMISTCPFFIFLLSFPFLFRSLLSIHPLLLFLSSSDAWMGKHIANARLNLSHVTTGFPLSPRKVRERGCCSMHGFRKSHRC